MNSIETIERLCAVVGKMSTIIMDQATFIEEQNTIDEAVKAEFEERRSCVDMELTEIMLEATAQIP